MFFLLRTESTIDTDILKNDPKINEVENIQRKSKLFLLTNHSF